MQPVESLDDRNRHPSRRPRAVQDVLVRERLAVPDLRRNDPSGNRKVPLGPSTLLPFSFHPSFYLLRARPPPPPGRHFTSVQYPVNIPVPWKARRTRHFAGYDVALVPPTLSLQGDTGAFPVCHRTGIAPARGAPLTTST